MPDSVDLAVWLHTVSVSPSDEYTTICSSFQQCTGDSNSAGKLERPSWRKYSLSQIPESWDRPVIIVMVIKMMLNTAHLLHAEHSSHALPGLTWGI